MTPLGSCRQFASAICRCWCGSARSHAAILCFVVAVATLGVQAQLPPDQPLRPSQPARSAVSPDVFGSYGKVKRTQSSNPIQHFVFIIKENRSFDSYFGAFPGADGASQGTTSTGQVVPLGPMPEGELALLFQVGELLVTLVVL